MNIVREADIAAPPEKVYEYLLDFTRHSEWTTPGHRVQITAESAGPTQVGSVFNCDAHQFGHQHDVIKVSELTPNRRIVYGVTMKDGNTFRHTMELSPSGTGTHLSKRFESLDLNLISKLTLPIGWLVAPKMLAKDMQRIKSRMEEPAS